MVLRIADVGFQVSDSGFSDFEFQTLGLRIQITERYTAPPSASAWFSTKLLLRMVHRSVQPDWSPIAPPPPLAPAVGARMC